MEKNKCLYTKNGDLSNVKRWQRAQPAAGWVWEGRSALPVAGVAKFFDICAQITVFLVYLFDFLSLNLRACFKIVQKKILQSAIQCCNRLVNSAAYGIETLG